MASVGLHNSVALPGNRFNYTFFDDDDSLIFLLNSQIKKGPHPVTSKLKQFIISGSLSASFTLLIALIAVIVGNSLKLYSQKQFDDQRQEFLSSATGFKILKITLLKIIKLWLSLAT